MKSKKPVTAKSNQKLRPTTPDPEIVAAYNRFQAWSPRERLEWAVNFVGNVGRIPKNEDDSRKLYAEMYSFVAVAGLAPIGHDTGSLWGQRIAAIFNPQPENRKAVRRFHTEILKTWHNMIQCALNREPVFVVRDEVWIVLTWSPASSRFVEETRFLQNYDVAAARALGKLLVDFGHLVKECPAPALEEDKQKEKTERGEACEKCETWFVASRPNKRYCSSACQSRATTAVYRASKKKKPKKKTSKKRKPK